LKRIWIPQVVASALLLWALKPDNPYGYYILLRWVCCAAFAYLAIQALAHEKQGWVWVLGVTAVVYNPIIRVHLTRGIWSVINVATIVVAVASIFVLKVEHGRKEPPNKTDAGDSQ
jgi:FtsH-binding integral membrane protein